MKLGQLIDLRKKPLTWKSTVAAGKQPRTNLGVLGISIGQDQSTGETSTVSEMATLTADQVKARNDAEAQRIFKKMIAAVKVGGTHIGWTNLDFIKGQYVVTIESSNSGETYGASSEMEDAVKASKLATFVKKSEHKGSFDWNSDTYQKPSSLVWFKF